MKSLLVILLLTTSAMAEAEMKSPPPELPTYIIPCNAIQDRLARDNHSIEAFAALSPIERKLSMANVMELIKRQEECERQGWRYRK